MDTEKDTEKDPVLGPSKDAATAAPGEDEIGMGEVQRDLGTGICTRRGTWLTQAPGSTH